MGYYTEYTLDVQNVDTQAQHDKIIEALESKGVWHYALHEGSYDETYKSSFFDHHDCAKWYKHDDDMIEISKMFPECTFKLTGFGDDRDDMWYALYKNGEYETCSAHIEWDTPSEIYWEE